MSECIFSFTDVATRDITDIISVSRVLPLGDFLPYHGVWSTTFALEGSDAYGGVSDEQRITCGQIGSPWCWSRLVANPRWMSSQGAPNARRS
jgi:hypothetical protein